MISKVRMGRMNLTEILLFIGFVFSFFVVLRVAKNRAKNVANPHAARLQRIRNVSLLGQILMGLFFLLGTYSVLAFLCGWPFLSQGHIRVPVSHNHIYTSPGEMPGEVFGWWLVQSAAGLGLCVALFALFRLYFKGIFFSVKNIRLIQSLGLALILGSIADYQMQAALRDVDWSTNSVFIGLLIIFLSWIMDEGRKIQEEQELTV